MGLTIIGNIFNCSGYAIHTRKTVNALNEIGVDVRLDTPKPQHWERLCTDAEFNMIEKPFNHNDTSIMIAQPQFWRFALAEKPANFYGFLVFEGDKIPNYWIEYLLDERVDKILVPSKHTKKAIMNSLAAYHKNTDELLTVNKIEIIPHGYDSAKLYPEKNAKKRI